MTAFLHELAKNPAQPMFRSRALCLAGGAIVVASASPRRAWSPASDYNARGRSVRGRCVAA